jgi:hypothetical protein
VVVSATDPYGRILDFLDRSTLVNAMFIVSHFNCSMSLRTAKIVSFHVPTRVTRLYSLS